MSHVDQNTTRPQPSKWERPELKRLEAGSAEANATGINDGGPVGNAQS